MTTMTRLKATLESLAYDEFKQAWKLRFRPMNSYISCQYLSEDKHQILVSSLEDVSPGTAFYATGYFKDPNAAGMKYFYVKEVERVDNTPFGR